MTAQDTPLWSDNPTSRDLLGFSDIADSLIDALKREHLDPVALGVFGDWGSLLIGKGGETIRGLSEEFESQIDVNDDGQVLIYSANGELGDALVERIKMMMKEVEVGDEYL